MRLIVALRLAKEGQAQAVIESPTASGTPCGRLINWNIERRLPALRNIIEFFRATGSLPAYRTLDANQSAGNRVAEAKLPDCRLYWCEIESELAPEQWASAAEVELVLVKERFDAFLQSIRSRAGSAYIDACEAFARQLTVTGTSKMGNAVPGRGCEQAA